LPECDTVHGGIYWKWVVHFPSFQPSVCTYLGNYYEPKGTTNNASPTNSPQKGFMLPQHGSVTYVYIMSIQAEPEALVCMHTPCKAGGSSVGATRPPVSSAKASLPSDYHSQGNFLLSCLLLHLLANCLTYAFRMS
jgi:hypothetical protein